MNRIESVESVASGAAKAAATAAPAATGVAMWVSKQDINFWVGVAGIAFIALQAAYLSWKWYGDWVDRRYKRRGRR